MGFLVSYGGFRLKIKQKEVLFSELYSLLSSGLDFSKAFSLLIEAETNKKVKKLLSDVFSSVVSGKALYVSLKDTGVFSNLDCGVVRIGEETGRLSESLRFLSDYYHKKDHQSRMIKSAVSYPLVVLSMAVIVVMFMMAVVVPMFEQVYSRMNTDLPTLTQWIISMSSDFPVYMAISIVCIISVSVLLYMFRDNHRVRSAKGACMMKIPFVGNIVKKNHQANFCKLLYLLSSSGIPIVSSIEMLRSIITFYPYQNSFADINRGLTEGRYAS